MQYLLLIYENEKRFEKGYDPKEMAEYGAFGKEFAKTIKLGNALKPTSTATAVRVRDGKRLTTDGPFAELLLGLGEGPVGGQPLAVSHADGGGGEDPGGALRHRRGPPDHEVRLS